VEDLKKFLPMNSLRFLFNTYFIITGKDYFLKLPKKHEFVYIPISSLIFTKVSSQEIGVYKNFGPPLWASGPILNVSKRSRRPPGT